MRRYSKVLTPSVRFPLHAGGTEPLRGSPREAGGTCRRGAITTMPAKPAGSRRPAHFFTENLQESMTALRITTQEVRCAEGEPTQPT
jgi:hypothetical protein